MNCSEFEAELERQVEVRSLTLSESAASHATGCHECSRRWRDQRLIDAAVRAWLLVSVPSSLAVSALSQLLAERPISLQPAAAPNVAVPNSRSWIAVAATAACLFAMIGLAVVARPVRQQPSLAQQDSNALATPDQHQPPVEVASSVVAVLDDLRSEYHELAAETSATARELAEVLPSSRMPAWIEVGSPARPEVTDTRPTSLNGEASPTAVSAISKSIGSQIGQAMDFLWVAVPDGVPRG